MTHTDHNALREKARQILLNNDRGGYTVPNGDVYPFQWNWDSPFTALGWLTFDENRAWSEIEKLLAGQWSNGMVPSIVFHTNAENYFPGPEFWQTYSAKEVATTGITQIPVLALGVELMYRCATDKQLAQEKVSVLFNKLFAYQQWFYLARKSEQHGLCQLFHGWESMDNSPLWDEALARVTPTRTNFVRKDKQHVPIEHRPKEWDYLRYISIVEQLRAVEYDSRQYEKKAEMIIIDAAQNAILYESSCALLRLHKEFGSEEQKAQLTQWIAETENNFAMLWDNDYKLYVDYDVITQKKIREKTSGGLIPLAGGFCGDNEQEYRQRLQEWIDSNMPSVFVDSTTFDPVCYWRGPSWTIINFLVYYGALKRQWYSEAKAIQQKSLEQIVSGDFYENFNPLNNQGCGGKNFSWTAASYLFWLDSNGAYDFTKIL